MKAISIDPRTLAGMNLSQTAEAALRELGCTLSPAHERLWIVPAGKMRVARRIARDNRYPAAFRRLQIHEKL